MVFKIIKIIFITLLLIGLMGYRFLLGPSVSIKERVEVKKYVEDYLTMKYGDHNYKVTKISYEYDMDTFFDYSNPTGYWVYFKSDIISDDSWIIINGLNQSTYKVDNDSLVEDYYFPNMYGSDLIEKMNSIEPEEELEQKILNELQTEFDPDICEFKSFDIHLEIPENYGRIPTFKELETDISLYRISYFKYEVSNSIKNTDKYEEELKLYIKNKYNNDLESVDFYEDNTRISVDWNN